MIHDLKRDRLGLGHEEEDEECGQDHQRSEEEVHAVAPGIEHLWGEARDDEVPEPVVGSCPRLTEGTKEGTRVSCFIVVVTKFSRSGGRGTYRVFWSYISEFMTQGVPFQEGV